VNRSIPVSPVALSCSSPTNPLCHCAKLRFCLCCERRISPLPFACENLCLTWSDRTISFDRFRKPSSPPFFLTNKSFVLPPFPFKEKLTLSFVREYDLTDRTRRGILLTLVASRRSDTFRLDGHASCFLVFFKSRLFPAPNHRNLETTLPKARCPAFCFGPPFKCSFQLMDHPGPTYVARFLFF